MRFASSTIPRLVLLLTVLGVLLVASNVDAPDAQAGTCTSWAFCNDCDWDDKKMTFICDRVDENGSCNCISTTSGCTEWDVCTYSGSGDGFPIP